MKLHWLFVFLLAGSMKLPAQVPSPSIRQIQIQALDSLIQNRSNPLIINFWATFCKPCLEEIPFFEKEVSIHLDKGLELWLVSLDMAELYPQKLQLFVQKKGFVSTQFWLNETNADLFCPVIDPKWSGAIPATLFINPKTGYRKFYEQSLTRDELKKAIQLLLN